MMNARTKACLGLVAIAMAVACGSAAATAHGPELIRTANYTLEEQQIRNATIDELRAAMLEAQEKQFEWVISGGPATLSPGG